ncbi:hypothetical protein [Polyangium mundeleinium]|uniref:Uncharacterized protein n=1 Tax=Polyangium mundeleinium TaxID=2995306 RepID=A0ABT5EP12_9BACT|nr:hypothetical protein [Polyangium mundeleinium]MDC0742495.1 hypothetical protein [Polyangium mundeleinium]
MSDDGTRTAAPLVWCEAGLVARVAPDRVLVREPGGRIHEHGLAPSWIAAALDPTGDLVLADGERVLHADGRVALLDERAHLGAPDVLWIRGVASARVRDSTVRRDEQAAWPRRMLADRFR